MKETGGGGGRGREGREDYYHLDNLFSSRRGEAMEETGGGRGGGATARICNCE
jgi:hypothetical protein